MIHWLGYIVLAFTGIQLIVALINLLSETHIPYSASATGSMVSVLIPARNEAKNIGAILNDLLQQSYWNMEIIVFDDESFDNTAEIVRNFSRKDERITLLSGTGLPGGWLGKTHACYCLAKEAKGEYLLFLDADVRIGGSIINDSITYSKRTGCSLVSVFPQQEIVTTGELLTVPNMNYILLSLLPLILVRRTRFSSLAAANGQFMFFEAGTYMELQPHKKMKAHKVEDILISRFYKSKGKKAACMLGDERIRCRMYSGFREAVNGFSKNIAEFFGGSFLAALLFWAVTSFGFTMVLGFPAGVFAIYIISYFATRIFISLSSRQNVLKNVALVLPLQVSMGLILVKSITAKFYKGYQWKGRNI